MLNFLINFHEQVLVDVDVFRLFCAVECAVIEDVPSFIVMIEKNGDTMCSFISNCSVSTGKLSNIIFTKTCGVRYTKMFYHLKMEIINNFD